MIQINDDWRIDTDGNYNIHLRRKTKPTLGRAGGNWDIVGYYQCYEHVLGALIEKRLLIPDGLQSLVDEIAKLRGEIKAGLMIIESNPDRFRLLGAKPIAEIDAEAKAKRKKRAEDIATSGAMDAHSVNAA